MGSSTGFFEKYAAFGALLMYLFDFPVLNALRFHFFVTCFDQKVIYRMHFGGYLGVHIFPYFCIVFVMCF